MLTAAAVLTLAASCQSLVAPVTILHDAMIESGLDPAAVHVNVDGTRDLGLMQINERNLVWLGLRDPFDACQSIRAASDLLASFSRYNTGSPTRGISYARKVIAKAVAVTQIEDQAHSAISPLNLLPRPARVGRDLLAKD